VNPKILDNFSKNEIRPDSNLVLKHLRVLKEMVRIDSRSFSVNEFEGDRKTPSDMKEILACASNYLRQIGFKKIKINTPPESCLVNILWSKVQRDLSKYSLYAVNGDC